MIRVFWVDSQKTITSIWGDQLAGWSRWNLFRNHGISGNEAGIFHALLDWQKRDVTGKFGHIFCIGSFIYIEEVLSVQTNTNYMNQHMLMECSMVSIDLNMLIFDLTMTFDKRAIVLLAKSHCISTTNAAEKNRTFWIIHIHIRTYV